MELGRAVDVSGSEVVEASRTVVEFSFFSGVLSEASGDTVLDRFGEAELAEGKAAALKLADRFRRRPIVVWSSERTRL